MTKGNATKKILIIEDEGDICLLLNIILSENKIEIDHVKSIAQAKEYLENEVPSIVLLDNKLPDGRGLDFIDFIRENYPATKIVMITGDLAASAKEVALANGADIFLEKPFTKDQVYNSVHELLN
ncbi:MAG: response regulator [Bacteroidetes bacterium]|nr:response regulator [Bacteroidota bacterium]